MLRLATAIMVFFATPSYAQQPATPSKFAPGELYDIGSHKLHLHCTGKRNAKMTVLFESGAGGSSKDWSRVMQLLSPDIKACRYDRAGSGWSEPGPEPRTMNQEVFELRALLKAANIRGPFILVGQSIGGLLVRLYAEKYIDDVAGVVLVDPTHESSMLGSMRYGGWVRLREKAGGEPIPEPHLGKENPEPYNPKADYMAEEFQQIYLLHQRDPVPLEDRPLIVLCAGKRLQPPGTPDSLWRELRHERDSLIRDLSHLSRNSKFILDASSGHAIHYDNPGLIARSIAEIFHAAATKSRLSR